MRHFYAFVLAFVFFSQLCGMCFTWMRDLDMLFFFLSQDYRQYFETFAGKMLCFWTEWCGLFMLSIEFMLLCRNPLLRLKCHSLGIINVKWQMDTISKDATENFQLQQFWSWSQNSRFAEFRHRAILFNIN